MASNTKQLTPRQLDALARVAKYYGRTWKSTLRQAWMTGQYGCYMEDREALQNVRNSYGPSWLANLKLPAKDENNG